MLHRVYVPCIGYHLYVVDANSCQEAIDLVSAGQGSYQSPDELNEDTDTNHWEAELDNH